MWKISSEFILDCLVNSDIYLVGKWIHRSGAQGKKGLE